MVLDKVRTDGLMPTLEAVRNKLDQPLPLGYCNVGVVLEVGAGVDRLRGRRPRGLERQARRGGERAGEPVRASARRRIGRRRRVHRARRDRPAGHPAGAADARRDASWSPASA